MNLKLTDVRAATIPAYANDNGGDPFAVDLVNTREPLHGYAMFLTQDRAAADDLVQETLERALANRRQFALGTNLKAWTTSIMRSRFLDERRRIAIRRRAPDLSPPVAPPTPADARLELLSMADVEEALATLSPQNRELFKRAYIDRVSYQELSVQFDMPVNTVGTRLRRLRLKVRVILEQVYRARAGAPVTAPC
jgi:RNA polymerase sigma-70 factor, ECF subfamily